MHIAGRREVAGAPTRAGASRAALVGTFRPISAKSNLGLVAWTVVKHVRPDRGDVAGALGRSAGF